MLAKVQTLGLMGLDAYPVEVDVDVANGLPGTTIVGLPDSCLKESRERVRSGIKNSGLRYPQDKITISLAPAAVRKEGASFDLPIALGILAASQQINPLVLQDFCFAGELALDGQLRPIRGALAMAQSLTGCRIKKLILPFSNAREACFVESAQIYAFKTLRELVEALHAPDPPKACRLSPPWKTQKYEDHAPDFSDVKGQFLAKRAFEIAASGGHNILLIGPPGSGKTMLAKRLPSILPEMTAPEAVETTKIYSAAGMTRSEEGLMTHRPFRAPHHTISDIALAGGGSCPQPGEISLAHNGVLFLDELPEFRRNVLEILRQPLEEGCIRVSRIQKSLNFPASFLLVAAMNPCPCGFFTDPRKACRCHSLQIQKYRGKISGPLLDRIDLHLELPAVLYQELTDSRESEPSSKIKARVEAQKALQRERFKNERFSSNAQMHTRHIKKYCVLEDDRAGALLKMAMTELGFTARAYDKILKVSRTIADMAGKELIGHDHLAEAIQYRNLDRQR
ncbi:MAG: YifB family Mg chelatase-like AAA ATPase [Candidatus Omnitrophota bacterium]